MIGWMLDTGYWMLDSGRRSQL